MADVTIGPGDRVRIRKNDAMVEPGSVGTVHGPAAVPGYVLVDVDGRGRVSLAARDVTPIAEGALVETNGQETDVATVLEELAAEAPPRKRGEKSPEGRARIAEATRQRNISRAQSRLPALTPDGTPDWARDAANAVRAVLGKAASAGAPTPVLSQMLAVIKHLENPDKAAS